MTLSVQGEIICEAVCKGRLFVTLSVQGEVICAAECAKGGYL